MRLQNLDGWSSRRPFKQAACALAGALSVQAREVGPSMPCIRRPDGDGRRHFSTGWDVSKHFDRRDYSFIDRLHHADRRGGAGRAIAVAIAHQGPRTMQIFDVETSRATAGEEVPRSGRTIDARFGEPTVGTSTSAECLARWNAERSTHADRGRAATFRANRLRCIVKRTARLLTVAQQSGCRTVFGAK